MTDQPIKTPASTNKTILITGILLSLAAGAGAGFLVNRHGEHFQLPSHLMVTQPPPELLGELNATRPRVQQKNAALSMGIVGALLGGCLGLVAGCTRARFMGFLRTGSAVRASAGSSGGHRRRVCQCPRLAGNPRTKAHSGSHAGHQHFAHSGLALPGHWPGRGNGSAAFSTRKDDRETSGSLSGGPL